MNTHLGMLSQFQGTPAMGLGLSQGITQPSLKQTNFQKNSFGICDEITSQNNPSKNRYINPKVLNVIAKSHNETKPK